MPDLPASPTQRGQGLKKDAARPGSTHRESPRVELRGAKRPAWKIHRRPARGEAVARRESAEPQAWGTSRCAKCTPTRGVRGPARGLRMAQGVPLPNWPWGSNARPLHQLHAAGRSLSLIDDRRESNAQSVRSLRARDGPSRFLGTKHWKKPETAISITTHLGPLQRFWAVARISMPGVRQRWDNAGPRMDPGPTSSTTPG